MRLSLIAAVADNGVIGRRGALPWRLSSDLKRFKRLTTGHHLLIGRRTWESLGRALPDRVSVVISRGTGSALTRGGRSRSQHPPELPDGVRLAASLDEAIAVAAAAGGDEAFVIGGGELYRAALPRCDRVYLTRVHARVEGDVRFPEFTPEAGGWRMLSSEKLSAGERDDHPTTFEVWERTDASRSRS